MAIFIFVGQQRHKSGAVSRSERRYYEELSANDVFFELFSSIGDATLQGQVKMKLVRRCSSGTRMSDYIDVRINYKAWNKPA
jgi:hypothetical protein